MRLFGNTKPLGLFRDLVHVAGADGNISHEEAMLLTGMGLSLGLTRKDIQKVLTKPDKVKYVAPKDDRGKLKHLLMCVHVMIIDGKIHQRERDLCMKIAAKLDLPPSLVDRIVKDFLVRIAGAVQRQAHRQRKPVIDLDAQIDQVLRSLP